MTLVKFCGITRVKDALCACSLGAHALGFVFAPSPRQVSRPRALEIIGRLPPFVATVGVFVNEALEMVEKTAAVCGLDLVQLHGEEPPDYCERLMPRALKALRVGRDDLEEAALAYKGKVRGFLLDTYSPKAFGGTGRPFDWNHALSLRSTGIPLVLAGGLGPGNVAQAVTMVKPWAVDACSGVERAPGVKDQGLMEAFMKRVRSVEEE